MRTYYSPATIIQRSRRMKLVIGTVATVSGVLFALSMASANPSLLPKHEGYPMKNSGSPVTGQPTANDPGQSDARGEKAELQVRRLRSKTCPAESARSRTMRGSPQARERISSRPCRGHRSRSLRRSPLPRRSAAIGRSSSRAVQRDTTGGCRTYPAPPVFLCVRSEWGL